MTCRLSEAFAVAFFACSLHVQHVACCISLVALLYACLQGDSILGLSHMKWHAKAHVWTLQYSVLVFQAKHAKDERDAAENARIDAAVAAADRKAQEAAQRLAEKRRVMQQECDKVRKQLPSASVCT